LFYFPPSYEDKLIIVVLITEANVPPKETNCTPRKESDHPDLYCLLAEVRGSPSSALVMTIAPMRGLPCSTIAPGLVSGGGSYCNGKIRMEVFPPTMMATVLPTMVARLIFAHSGHRTCSKWHTVGRTVPSESAGILKSGHA